MSPAFRRKTRGDGKAPDVEPSGAGTRSRKPPNRLRAHAKPNDHQFQKFRSSVLHRLGTYCSILKAIPMPRAIH